MENDNEQINTGFEFHGEIRFPYYLMTITKKFKNREDAISYRDELSKKIKEAISKKTEYIEIENNIIIVSKIDYIQLSIVQGTHESLDPNYLVKGESIYENSK